MIYALFLLALTRNVFGDDVIISTASDFINFTGKVNAGTNYSGTTVYLNSDLSLSGAINPIGTNTSNYFCGVFDGKGHIISNLVINSSSHAYTGLFGYSTGLTVRNVVLSPSCSITNSFNGSSSIYVGGFIGYCESENEQCNIENSVNMADVTFDGKIINKFLFIGGVIGQLYSSSYVKNCANYGSVAYLGISNYTRLGGIVGDFALESSYYRNIYNCINFGTITHNGTTKNDLYIGGILGFSYYAYIENCVSAGKISTQTTASEYNFIGSIVGNVGLYTYINYCYYTSDVDVSSINGAGSPSITGTPNSPTDVNSDLVSKLNSNATSCNWNKWLLNPNKAAVTFKMNDDKELSFSSQVILTPNPVKEGNSFLFWCKDAECTEVFDPATESVNGNINLYAGWVNGTVTFDFGNGTTVNETFSYNTEITYPDMKKEGYTLSWENHHEFMPARDITVTAQWTANIYTVTFNASGGEESVPASKPVAYDEKYGDLPKPKKEGYMFIGWFTNEINGTEVTNETIVTIPDNHTLYAHWEEVTNQVEIVFNKKDLTREEAKNIIKQYTNASFEIIHFENESGEIRTIIKFSNKEEAENFVESINEQGGSDDFKQAKFVFGDRSFSTTVYPHSFLNALFL